MYRSWLLILLVVPLASLSQMKMVIESSIARNTFSGGAVKTSTTQTEAKALWTISARALVETRMAASLFFSGGIAFETKGSQFLINRNRPDYSDRNMIIYYLALPMGIFTKFSIAKQDICLGANLYAAWAVRGYEKGTQGSITSGSPLIVYNRLTLGSANADPTQFHPTVVSGSDYGAEVFTRIHIKKMRLGVRYTRGFTGILVNRALYDRQYYHTGVAFTVAYQL